MKSPGLKTHDISSLLEFLSSFHPLIPGIEQYFQKHTVPCFARRKKLLLKAGSVCSTMYFIKKGVLRGFIKEGRKDITTWITIEGHAVTSIAGLDVQAPSQDNIEAIEDCELLAMSYKALEGLYNRFPESNIVIRKILLRYYHDAEERAFISRLTHAEAKYEYFLKTMEHLSNRVPLKYIASFLGITEETLSRVRKKLANTTGGSAKKRLHG